MTVRNSFFYHYIESVLNGGFLIHRNIKNQHMNLNNGDNQQKACFVMIRADLNILSIVTIVEVHMQILHVCDSTCSCLNNFFKKTYKPSKYQAIKL